MPSGRRFRKSGEVRNSEALGPPPAPDFTAQEVAKFVSRIGITKSDAIKKITRILRDGGFDYEQTKTIFKEARRRAGIKPKQRPKRLPELPTSQEVTQFFAAVDRAANPVHAVMFRLLLYTGLRVSELVALRRSDIDLGRGTAHILRGKGNKSRRVLLPNHFRVALVTYLAATQRNEFLFESRLRKPYSSRRIQQLVASYARDAGLNRRFHPHLFRHLLLTELTREGLSDAQIQLISGHASKKSLEVYQHLGLAAVEDDYQNAMRRHIL